ncbi:MAG TPA: gliding motility-associated C-terminal domain-containing protein [Ohtaekwangia sp.]
MGYTINRDTIKALTLFGAMLLPAGLYGQIVIGSGQMAALGTPDIVVQASSDVTNNSSFDFAGTNLVINLVGADQYITGTFVIKDLHVDGGGTKHVNRPMTITHSLTFSKGIVIPNAKLLFTGSDISGANDDSYVSGPFSVLHSGKLTFPIGMTAFGYAPAYLEEGSGSDEVTMQVVGANPGLTPSADDLELVSIDNLHYWELSTTHPEGIAGLNSRITLSTLNSEISSELSPVVVQAGALNATAINLGSASVTADAVTSRAPVTESILALGGSTEVELVIHDMITPFTKGDANDYLYIESIEKFDFNKVTLLDRWGVLVKEWKNFTNYDDPLNPNPDGYDFAKLSPGNYICIVEYGFSDGPARKKSQMVTVLKAK